MDFNGFFMFLEEFIQYLTLEKKYSAHTINAYKTDVFAFRDFFIANYAVDTIHNATYVQIRPWIVALVEKKISNRSINRKVASLKAYYSFLLKIEELTTNPLARHKALKISKKIQLPFSEKEVANVMLNFPEPTDFQTARNKLIVELLYATGMRRAELIDLKVEDIDTTTAKIKVLGKRNKERIIPLIPSVLKTLISYQGYRDKVIENHKEPYFLLTEKGVKIYEMLVYRVVNSYFSEVSTKVKKSPHILRHSFATHMLAEGADLNAIKELLGHSSLAATQVYTNQSISKLSEVYKKSHPRNK